MKAKQYLQQLQKLDSMIEQKLQELYELKKLQGIRAIDYTKQKVQCSRQCGADFETILIKIIDMENEINAEIDRFIDSKHGIINQIQLLENEKYMQVLYKRYVEYKRLEMVACEMNYTFQYVVLLHGQALKAFERKFL
ncbi:hypothetical protein [Clostridium sp. MD294]|uniref:hypothetical protein n=1 Tax=Clostridium sp. MD294 TaxID=97138 RepID=UPI0002C952A3|nr:hypothetical protein [Clostridium sp. MD294]NDO45986.1 hypothetical protein [Clostridium sp. MD294]USF30353.1 hypothetical protein C820_001794 [Clostridium sp. MD294]